MLTPQVAEINKLPKSHVPLFCILDKDNVTNVQD